MKKQIITLLLASVALFGNHAYAVSDISEASIDTSSYQSIVQSVLDKNAPYSNERKYGLLYDIDHNGVEELILLYETTARWDASANPMPCIVTSLYTMRENKVVSLLEEAVLYPLAGGPSGFAGAVRQNDTEYFCIYSGIGETFEGKDTWDLYTVNGTTLKKENTIEYQYKYEFNDFTHPKGSVTQNAIATTWSDADYEQWVNTIQKVAVLDDNSDFLLKDLLIELKNANPETPSSWAVTEVEYARSMGLIPSQLDTLYQQNITREEFCELSVQFLSKKTGLSISELLEKYGLSTINGFVDTHNPASIAMNALGIVKGVGDNRFNPDANITREQAAVILWRLCGLFHRIEPNTGTTLFSDDYQISSWAEPAVRAITSCSYNGNSIMNGTGQNRFSPKASYSREQAILTMVRLYGYIGDANMVSGITPDIFIDSIDDVAGEWTIDTERTMEANGVSMRSLFGSGIKYGYEMKIGEDSSFSYGIGISAGGQGKIMMLPNNRLRASYLPYEENTEETIELQGFCENSEDITLVMELWDYMIYWVRKK